MRRNNQVTLDGEILAPRVGISETGVPLVRFQVRTEWTDGGTHRAVAYGRLAAEVVVFSQAAAEAEAPVEVTVRGWLRSLNGCAEVVASRITFHLPREVRERAAERVRMLLNGDGDGVGGASSA